MTENITDTTSVMGDYLISDALLSTSAPDTCGIPVYWGWISCVVAVVFFGSNWVPVKKFETGDGMFFQWVSCAAIWLTGLAIHLFRYPHGTFYPLAMVGGILWCTGNVMTVPIIKTIGLSQGLLVWGSANLIAGWASGRFGWFGLDAEIPSQQPLNYIGMALCFSSAFLYILIKTDVKSRVETKSESEEDTQPILGHINEFPIPDSNLQHSTTVDDDVNFIDTMSPPVKRISGTVMSLIAGLLYGVNFAPVIYIQNHYKTEDGDEVSQLGLDYVFSHWCGVLATSSAFLIVYCAYMQNKPRIYPESVLPGVAAGVMWAIADAAWFVANSCLSEPVSFPIVTTGPGMVAAMWGIFYGEIRGLRNYVILCIAFAVTITGAVLTAMSKN